MWTVDICTLKGQLIGLIEDHIDRRSVQAAVTDCRTGNVGRAECEVDLRPLHFHISDRGVYFSVPYFKFNELKKKLFLDKCLFTLH